MVKTLYFLPAINNSLLDEVLLVHMTNLSHRVYVYDNIKPEQQKTHMSQLTTIYKAKNQHGVVVTKIFILF